jgi:drug/metabolite transporter (DMT)-like permease
VSDHLRLKTRVFVVIVVLANVLGNFFMSWGVKRRGSLLGLSMLEYIRVILDPWVAFGVTLLIIWMLSRMALLSWADLSYVVPVTAIGYVLTAVLGRVVLGEQISGARWAGTLFIVAGIALVGSTSIRTTAPEAPRE